MFKASSPQQRLRHCSRFLLCSAAHDTIQCTLRIELGRVAPLPITQTCQPVSSRSRGLPPLLANHGLPNSAHAQETISPHQGPNRAIFTLAYVEDIFIPHTRTQKRRPKDQQGQTTHGIREDCPWFPNTACTKKTTVPLQRPRTPTF